MTYDSIYLLPGMRVISCLLFTETITVAQGEAKSNSYRRWEWETCFAISMIWKKFPLIFTYDIYHQMTSVIWKNIVDFYV